jgi:hypothetical protein
MDQRSPCALYMTFWSIFRPSDVLHFLQASQRKSEANADVG